MSKRIKLDTNDNEAFIPPTLVDGYRNPNYLLSLEKTYIGSGTFGVVYRVTIKSQDSATYAVALKIFFARDFTRKRERIPFFNNMLEKTDASLWPCAVIDKDHPTKPYFAEGVCDGSNVVVCVMGICTAVNKEARFHQPQPKYIEAYADNVSKLAQTCFENNVYVLDFKRENLGWNGTDLCLLDIDAVLYPENIFLANDDILYYEMFGFIKGCIRTQNVEIAMETRVPTPTEKFKVGDKVCNRQLYPNKSPEYAWHKELRYTVKEVSDDYVIVTESRLKKYHALKQCVHGDGLNLNEATKKQLALITLFLMLGEAGGFFGPKLIAATDKMEPGVVVMLMIQKAIKFWKTYVTAKKTDDSFDSFRVPEKHLKWLYHTFMTQAAGQVAESVQEASLLASFNDRAVF